jgi:hypothetical protein
MASLPNPLDIFGKTSSGPGFVSPDQQTQGLMAQGVSLASRPAGDFATQSSQGMEGGLQSQLQGAPQASQEAARMGVQPGQQGFNTALRNQYNAYAGRQLGGMMATNRVNAEMQKANMMNQYAKAYLGQQRAMTENYANLTQAFNQNEQARAQFISQLFGAADYGIGMNKGGMRSQQTPFNVPSSGGRVGAYSPEQMNYGGNEGLEYA